MRDNSDGEEADQRLEIVALFCQGCVADVADAEIRLRACEAARVRVSVVPCSIKVQTSHIFRILEDGADAVELIACPENACRSLDGSRGAERRVARARDLLDKAGMGSERLGLTRRSDLTGNDLADIARLRAEAVSPLGPSPMKKERPR